MPDKTIAKPKPDATDSTLQSQRPQPGTCLEDVRDTVVGRLASGNSPIQMPKATDSHSGFRSSSANDRPTGTSLDLSKGSYDGVTLGDNSKSKETRGFVSEKQNDDGTITRTKKNGDEYTFTSIKLANGSRKELLETVVKPDGTGREFKYEDAGNKSLPTRWINHKKDASGNVVDETYSRDGKTNDFVRTKADGKTERLKNVELDEDGEITYERPFDSAIDQMADKNVSPFDKALNDIIGRRIHHGTLDAEREHLLSVGSNLFNGNLAKHLDAIEARLHKNESLGIKAPTDDEIGEIYKAMSRIMETTHRTGGAKNLSQSEIKKNTEEFLLIYEDPDKYNNQKQVGSCYLQAIHYIHEVAGDPRLANHYADALTKGTATTVGGKSLAFNSFDLRGGVGGQTAGNHILDSLLYKGFAGSNAHVTTGYGGTATFQGQKSSMALFNEKFPVFTLGARISKAALDRACKQYGGAATITMGGSHAQATTRNRHDKAGTKADDYVLANWWDGMRDGPINMYRYFNS